MSIKGVTLKSESFFSISPGVLELWRKNLRGVDSTPGPDRVKANWSIKNFILCIVPKAISMKSSSDRKSIQGGGGEATPNGDITQGIHVPPGCR